MSTDTSPSPPLPAAPLPSTRTLAWVGAVSSLVAPCAGLFVARRYREGGFWLLLRSSMLLLSPWVLLNLGTTNTLAWALLLAFCHGVFAVRNAARSYGVLRHHPPQQPLYALGGGFVLLCTLGLVFWDARVTQKELTFSQVATQDMVPGLNLGEWVMLDLRDVHEHPPVPGDLVWHRCLDKKDTCIHRVVAVGPTTVSAQSALQDHDVVLPPHWLYVLGDHLAVSQDGRQQGPMPPTNVLGRVRVLQF